MTPHPSRDAWDDDRIDRALRQALDVEPSPALPARVRTRIASEPVPGSVPFARWTWAACAAVAVVAIAVLKPGFDRESIPPARAAAIAAAVFPLVPYHAAVRPVAAGLADRRDQALQPHRPRRANTLFATADREAFALFVAFSRRGQLPPIESLPPAGAEPDVVLPAIEIPIIDIPWLVVAGPDEGEQP